MSGIPEMTAAARDLVRARAFVRGIDDRAATRVEPFPFGTAYFHDRLRTKWSFNFLRVETDADEVEPGALAAEADRLQGGAGLRHRRLVFFDERGGVRAAGPLAAAGWRVQPEAVMVYRGGAESDPGRSPVQEVDLAALRQAREEAIRSYPEVEDEQTVAQLLEADEVVGRATDARYFAYLADGAVVSFCHVYSDGATAQIEDVGTLPAFRNRGYSRAVLSKALAETVPSHELTFLTAVEDDWPKDFYARVGFEPIGLNYAMDLAPNVSRG
jgi:ribosomal protein S18 acetylase RimI-like enzyme